MTGLTWRKASASKNGYACVEVASVPAGVLVRDSKDPEGTRLAFTPAAWRAFLAGVVKDAPKGGGDVSPSFTYGLIRSGAGTPDPL